MSLPDLASIGSLVSGVAVLLSLVYLAQQTRQNSKHTMALIHQGRVEQTTGWINAVASDPSLTDILMRGGVGDVTLDDTQTSRLYLTQLSNFYALEDLSIPKTSSAGFAAQNRIAP